MFRSVSMSSTGSSMTGLRYCVVQFCSGPSVVPTPCESREFVDDGALVIRAEMAGLDPDKDVEVSVEADVLHIAAERREEEKVKGRDYVRREMHYSSFHRDLPLPGGVQERREGHLQGRHLGSPSPDGDGRSRRPQRESRSWRAEVNLAHHRCPGALGAVRSDTQVPGLSPCTGAVLGVGQGRWTGPLALPRRQAPKKAGLDKERGKAPANAPRSLKDGHASAAHVSGQDPIEPRDALGDNYSPRRRARTPLRPS